MGALTYIACNQRFEPLAKVAQSGGTWDPVTDGRISNLHPSVRDNVTNFINAAQSELGINLRVADGYRSIDEQNAIYNQGRTTPGKIVSWAKFINVSKHLMALQKKRSICSSFFCFTSS